MQAYSQWLTQKVIYDTPPTKVELIVDQNKRLIRKTIEVNHNNRQYAKLELRLMRQFSSPHVVKSLHQETQKTALGKEQLIIYMPYYPNKDLEDYLLTHDPSMEKRISMLIDILTGIQELHTHFVIHRDLKLKNIFLDQNLNCSIGDLGVASKSAGWARSMLGTPFMQAPQVYSQRQYDFKVDMWGVGMIAYQLLNSKRNNKLPFPFRSPQQSHSSIQAYGGIIYQQYMIYTSKVLDMDPHVPQKLKEMVNLMLKNKEEERLGWAQLYQNKYLQAFDTFGRLNKFFDKYRQLQDLQKQVQFKIGTIASLKQKYFICLNYILAVKWQFFKNKYESIRDNKRELHLFYYRICQNILQDYKFIADLKIYRYIMSEKRFVKRVKDQMYWVEQKLNFWLRDSGQPEIAQNQHYLGQEQYAELKSKAEDVLKVIDEEEKYDSQMNFEESIAAV